ncbi:MAG: cbb3-type cytochrome oxidase assembly protein CcoS [Saprospiraceae bacterium]|nr:cbb3-type cytochrome oxidase assembly protein CcoS [Saprospiraceae bacterium]
MKIIILLVILSLIIAISFLIAFIWSVKSGQYEDIEGPPRRILFDKNIKK